MYIRYNKNTICGQLIENLKKQSPQTLTRNVLRLIFLSEIVEPSNLDIDFEILNETYYESLKLFSEKLEQTYYMLQKLSEQKILKKNSETASPFRDRVVKENVLPFSPSQSVVERDSYLSSVGQDLKSLHENY